MWICGAVTHDSTTVSAREEHRHRPAARVRALLRRRGEHDLPQVRTETRQMTKVDIHTQLRATSKWKNSSATAHRARASCAVPGAHAARRRQFFREIEDNCWDADRRLRLRRIWGHASSLSTVPVMFSTWAKPHDALSCRVFSATTSRHRHQASARFAGLATLPMQAPDRRERARALHEAGFSGIRSVARQ